MPEHEINPNPETQVTGILSGYAEQPYQLEIATKPMASTFGIVSTWGDGSKHVGFVMVGGTDAQFRNSVRLQRIKNERQGWKNWVFIHATAGTVIDDYKGAGNA